MSLHSTEALIVEGATAAESLPDPTTVSGRTHWLHNNFAGSQVWSSTGATPFVVNGVNSATLTVLRGQTAQLYSDGTRWNVIPAFTPAASESGFFQPAGYGLKAWTVDPVNCVVGSASLATSGLLHVQKLYLPSGTMTNIVMATTVGNTATNFFVALYDSAGNLLVQSANVQSLLTAASGVGFKTLPLAAPVSVAAGAYYVGFWYQGGTSPTFYQVQNDATVVNGALAPPNVRMGTSTTGLIATAPNPFGAQTKLANLWWLGVS